MNKAFIKEPERTADYCPRCGAKGEPVGAETLAAYLTDEQRGRITATANFCPSPRCEVAYFDAFERLVLAAELPRPVYPKNLAAPICACFGLTREDIERDVREGVVTRSRAAIDRAGSSAARCAQTAANGRSCVPYIQKCYMLCRQSAETGGQAEM